MGDTLPPARRSAPTCSEKTPSAIPLDQSAAFPIGDLPQPREDAVDRALLADRVGAATARDPIDGDAGRCASRERRYHRVTVQALGAAPSDIMDMDVLPHFPFLGGRYSKDCIAAIRAWYGRENVCLEIQCRI